MKLNDNIKNKIAKALEEETWLVNRILYYAKLNNYTDYTSTLREAWRLSIQGLSKSLLDAFEKHPSIPELNPDIDYTNEPLAEFGMLEAQKHRERGVRLSMFLGLFKYYQHVYLEKISEINFKDEEKNFVLTYITRCFNRIEIGYTTEWASLDESELVEKLQINNRYMTNEKNRYLTIFESIPVPVIHLNEKLILTNYNSSAARYFSFTQVPGSHYYSSTHTLPVVNELKEDLNKFINSEENTTTIEHQITTIDGEGFFDIRLMKMLNENDEYNGVIIILNDITERKNGIEKMAVAKNLLEQANKEKSQFIATISHELKTPLNGLIGLSDLLSSTMLTQKQQEYLRMIQFSSDMLHTLISDLIDFSKIESKTFELVESEFNLKNLLDDIIYMLNIEASKKNLYMKVDLSFLENHLFYGDHFRVKQVLINIINNAVKFTKKGGVTIQVNESIEYGHSSKITITITDTGIGISDEFIEKIYEPYKLDDAETENSKKGMGIGLSIVKQIIDAMNGSIDISSTEGKGTSVIFKISLKRTGSFLPKTEKSVKNIQHSEHSRQLQVLVAEDNYVSSLYLKELLEMAGHSVVVKHDGTQVLKEVQGKNFDLIIMDGQMPGVDGYETTRQLKANETTSHIPIIAATAHTMKQDQERFFQAGVDAYLSKPINMYTFFETINRVTKNTLL